MPPARKAGGELKPEKPRRAPSAIDKKVGWFQVFYEVCRADVDALGATAMPTAVLKNGTRIPWIAELARKHIAVILNYECWISVVTT